MIPKNTDEIYYNICHRYIKRLAPLYTNEPETTCPLGATVPGIEREADVVIHIR